MELREAMGAPAGFPFELHHVRSRLGLNREEELAIRNSQLKSGEDWIRHKKRVYLSPQGTGRLQTAVQAKNAAARPGAILRDGRPVKEDFTKKPAPQSEPERRVTTPQAPGAPAISTETLRVVRCDLANRRMLLCCRRGDDLDRPAVPVRVRVRDTSNFKRGMELPGRLVDGYQDLYDLARNLPRQKGKW